MFLGILDPDPLVRGMDLDQDPALDPDPDHSIINFISTVWSLHFEFLSLKNYVKVSS